MKKRSIYIAIAVHTLIILYVLWCDLTIKGENWSWLITFFADFPLSMALYPILNFVSERYLSSGAYGDSYTAFSIIKFATHLVIGGAWWVAVTLFVGRAFARIRSRRS